MNPTYSITATGGNAILMPNNPNKDEKSRITRFTAWLDMQGVRWYAPDLASYRDELLLTLSPSSVKVHLSTLRGRYEKLLRDNCVRDALFTIAEGSPADRKAFVDEVLVRLQNAVHPSTAEVRLVVKQDVADSEYLRLNPEQVMALLRAPGIETLQGLRDTAIFSLVVCTGIREAELCEIEVDDLRQCLGSELALRVRDGKGGKQRLVPYGPLDWCLRYVDGWLKAAGITAGPVFRGFYKGCARTREGALTTRQMNRVFESYCILVESKERAVQPHDLRRTYARNAYEQGMDLLRISQNLGHSSLKTTQGYIGNLDGVQRRPPLMFQAPHNYLRGLI